MWESGRWNDIKGEQLKFNLLICTVKGNHSVITKFSGKRKQNNSLFLQDGFDNRLCNHKAVWVHHAILSTDLSCAYKNRGYWAAFPSNICRKTGDFKNLTNNVVPDLFSDWDGPHSIRRDKPGEDGHGIFLYAWKRQSRSSLLQLLQRMQINSGARE